MTRLVRALPSSWSLRPVVRGHLARGHLARGAFVMAALVGGALMLAQLRVWEKHRPVGG